MKAKKTIMLVFGTRPEAIKMCPLVKELQAREGLKTVVCVSGQHREMLDPILRVFRVVPDYDLAVMRKGQTLSEVTGRILHRFGWVLDEAKPDLVLVHGDTTTAFTAALACFYRQIAVGHVEAGLRTYDLASPYPEEFNRQVIGMLATYHFAPTEVARQNLLREGKDGERIFVTGNTVIDALGTTVRSDFSHPDLAWAREGRMLLVTAHRRENLGDPMRGMFRALRRILEEYADLRAIYPIHLNPVVRKIAAEELGGCDRIRIIEPLSVVEFHNFLARSFLVLTDSGGIQEEAPSLGKPVLVMRDTTERPEGLAAGALRLVGTTEQGVYEGIRQLLEDKEAYERMARAGNPYGDGFASRRIADILACAE